MKALKHFKTITHHRHKVIANCFRAGIGLQGLKHDLSKYSPTEFIPGAKYYQGTRSPNESEREHYGYSKAWLHHKGRNKHHFEYWVDVNIETKKYGPVKMPYNYLAEMFCDRVAACKNYRGEAYTDADAYNYYEHSKSHYLIHPDTERLLSFLLKMLRDNGEEKTLLYIRYKVLKKS